MALSPSACPSSIQNEYRFRGVMGNLKYIRCYVFVKGHGGPGPGERVQVSVTIRHRPVTLLGEVIYTDRVQGFAVVFTDNPPERIEQLHELLDSAAAASSR
jgi:hypothetical protein